MSGAPIVTDYLTASAAMGMPMGFHYETKIWEVQAGPCFRQPSSDPRAWYFRFRIAQSLDPDQCLSKFQIRDILATAMLVKVGRSTTPLITEQADLANLRSFAELVIIHIKVSQARWYVVYSLSKAFVIQRYVCLNC
jgi:hypothetical protein